METRDSLLAQADRLLRKDNFTKEDKSKVDGLLSLADAQDPARMRLRKAKLTSDELELGLRTPETRATNEVYQNFMTALRNGADFLPPEVRAQSVGVDSAGGYVTPAQFSDSVFTNMAAFDRLFDPAVVDIQETLTGGSFSWPLVDDTTASATVISENLTFAESGDAVFDSLLMGRAKMWRADLIRISMELMQDSKFRLDDVLSQAFGVRLARGVGASMMADLLSQATVGKAAAGGQTSTVISEDIYDLIGSVNEFYRRSLKCGFMLRQATLDSIAKLKDSNGRPLGIVEYEQGRVPYLLGYPVFIAPSVPGLGAGSPAVGNKSILFGDFGAWKVRLVADSLKVKRLAERYAEYGQVAFTATVRCNGALGKASAADSPIKYFQNAAS
jgi:HK97 family phage major capsid protein